MNDVNTALLNQMERLQQQLDRTAPEIPDFSQESEVSPIVPYELVKPIRALMEQFQYGIHGRHEDLLKACAMVERALLSRYLDL